MEHPRRVAIMEWLNIDSSSESRIFELFQKKLDLSEPKHPIWKSHLSNGKNKTPVFFYRDKNMIARAVSARRLATMLYLPANRLDYVPRIYGTSCGDAHRCMYAPHFLNSYGAPILFTEIELAEARNKAGIEVTEDHLAERFGIKLTAAWHLLWTLAYHGSRAQPDKCVNIFGDSGHANYKGVRVATVNVYGAPTSIPLHAVLSTVYQLKSVCGVRRACKNHFCINPHHIR